MKQSIAYLDKIVELINLGAEINIKARLTHLKRIIEDESEQLQQGGVVRPEVESAKEGELLGNAKGKGVRADCECFVDFRSDKNGCCTNCGDRYVPRA